MRADAQIILGPPGTGKTTTLLSIVEQELEQGVDPAKIGYVSFTKKAANEAIERACLRFNKKPRDFPYFRTLHSVSFRFGGFNRADVLDSKKLPDFGEWAGVAVTGNMDLDDGSTFGNEEGDRCLFMYNLSRLKMEPLRKTFEDNYDDIPWQTVEYIARAYEKYKNANFLIDYTDMLERFGYSPRLEVLIIDEAQDLSPLQWRVAKQLSHHAERIYIAGDDDQAIYQWAGADVPFFISMPGTRRVLAQSWRVPNRVQRVAASIASRIETRTPKDWAPREAEGSVEWYDRISQMDWTGDDILVLARNVKYLDELRGFLRDAGYNFSFRGYPALPDNIRTAIQTWVALRKGESVDAGDVRRVYQYMREGHQITNGSRKLSMWGDGDMITMRDLVEHGGLLTDGPWHSAMPAIPRGHHDFIRAAYRNGERLDQEPRITLSTIHGSKGGEGTQVVLFTDMAGRTFNDSYRDRDSEHRVWYVGVTRAKRDLMIVHPKGEKHYAL